MKRLFFSAIVVVAMAFANQAKAQESVLNTKEHTTLVTAIKAAGLVETLKPTGPFTIFAPTNDAFSKLSSGTLETLEKPANKAALSNILTYHVVNGKMTSKELTAAIKAGGGKAELTTVEGGKISVSLDGKTFILKDEKGGTAKITTADIGQNNGVVHVVDTVLMPK